MKIEQTHHVDKSQPDEKGEYEWRYEYDLYKFIEGGRSLLARSYTNTSNEAHLLGFEEQAGRVAVAVEHFQDTLVKEAIQHLRSLGMAKIEYLGSEGYVSVPTEA